MSIALKSHLSRLYSYSQEGVNAFEDTLTLGLLQGQGRGCQIFFNPTSFRRSRVHIALFLSSPSPPLRNYRLISIDGTFLNSTDDDDDVFLFDLQSQSHPSLGVSLGCHSHTWATGRPRRRGSHTPSAAVFSLKVFPAVL